MSRAELVGGPLDGERVELPFPTPGFYFGCRSRVIEHGPEPVVMITSEVYGLTLDCTSDGLPIYSYMPRP